MAELDTVAVGLTVIHGICLTVVLTIAFVAMGAHHD
jgi:hypothetical protein